MKLSILIPMYNAQRYIGNCLDSLLTQALPEKDYEIIVMDDGSSDNSIEIVQGYVDNHSNVFLFIEENSGAYTTRNKLLKLAKGDYIYNLDADDYIVHNCLEDLLDVAKKNDLDIIGFKSKDTFELTEFELSKPIDKQNIVVISGTQLLEKDVRIKNEIWWYFVKRNLLEENNITFNKNEYNADVMFTLSVLLKAKRLTVLPNQIHRYVQTQDSLMRSSNFEIISKRVNYIHMMILNMNKLINDLKLQSFPEKKGIIKNLCFRRDVFAFFNIINMVRNHFPKKEIKSKISDLKNAKVYPLSHFLGKTYNSLKYRGLAFVINNEKLLYMVLSLKGMFFKNS